MRASQLGYNFGTIAIIELKTTAILWISFLLAGMIAMLSLSPIHNNSERSHEQLDSLQLDREKHLQSVLETIKGKETKPADSVFKNIQTMKGVPAGRLLRIMDVAYSQSLGVSCGHCHNTAKWDSEEKKAKQITRDMGKMMKRINMELLKDVNGLSNPSVNCTTCHRGERKPALSLQKSP